MKHTPTPWFAHEHFDKWCVSDNPAGNGATWVCEMIPHLGPHVSEQANAEFIAKAVNEHAALKECEKQLRYVRNILSRHAENDLIVWDIDKIFAKLDEARK